jgi:dTDP-4-dehydrorhamnose reductase
MDSALRVLIAGGQGQLGWELRRQATRFNITAVARDLPEIDITHPQSVARNLEAVTPRIVINAAAYTQVDRAEQDVEEATAVNATGPGCLAEACSRAAIPLIHISTDFVFDGHSRRPYQENDPVGPGGVYAQSKVAGETAVRGKAAAHIIIRTAWLYGVHGQNFVKTMLRLAGEREEIKVVADQHGCPTSAADLAAAIWHICGNITDSGKENRAAPWGTYHYCGAGVTSWHGLAQAAIDLAGRHTPLKARRITPIPAAQYPTPAQRPTYSALDCTKIRRTFGLAIPPWQESLAAVIQRIYGDRPPSQPR